MRENYRTIPPIHLSRLRAPNILHDMATLRLESARRLLCALQDHIQHTLVRARKRESSRFATIAGVTTADTIYHIDRISEEAITEWFSEHWPASAPVQVVMEGIEDDQPLTFPAGTPVAGTLWKCILDPIDGTRGLMYDKRPAWILAGLAAQRGAATNLSDIVVSAMTELPTSKQGFADQYSAVRGEGLRAQRKALADGKTKRLTVKLSTAKGFEHGFSSFTRFFPAGLTWLSELEETFWRTLIDRPEDPLGPVVFTDQYISTGGQIAEILAGHDRMTADLRPYAFARLGLQQALVCHPYDICTALLLEEAGGVIDDGWGNPLTTPLDTTSPVAWVAYANADLARQARPLLRRLLKERGVPAPLKRRRK